MDRNIDHLCPYEVYLGASVPATVCIRWVVCAWFGAGEENPTRPLDLLDGPRGFQMP